MILPRCATGVSHFCQQTGPGHGPGPRLPPGSHDALGLSSGARGEETVRQGMASALI